jgi:hypothetical protein
VRILKGVVTGLAVVGALGLLLAVAPDLFVDCRAQAVSSAVAPDGKTVARHVQRECKPDYVPKTDLEFRLADGRVVSIELGTARMNQVGLAWERNDRLIVTVPDELRAQAFDRTVQGIDVRFRVIEGSSGAE